MVILIVKSSFDSLRIAALAALSIAAVVLLNGCGQRGPLYMPGTQPPAKTQPKPIPKPSPVPTADTPATSK
jgi:predicted small lipoprotein YifL